MAKNTKLKAINRAKNKDTRPHAEAKYIRISSTKIAIVLDLIRGKKVDEAIAILDNTPNASCEVVKKLILSAIANGENNQGKSASDLYIAEIYATQGPSMERVLFRGRGKVDRITKRSSHIKVVLGEKAE